MFTFYYEAEVAKITILKCLFGVYGKRESLRRTISLYVGSLSYKRDRKNSSIIFVFHKSAGQKFAI